MEAPLEEVTHNVGGVPVFKYKPYPEHAGLRIRQRSSLEEVTDVLLHPQKQVPHASDPKSVYIPSATG